MFFWIAAIGLLLLALLILVTPLLRAQVADQADDRQQQNIDIARDKKTTLDFQLAQGELSQEEYDNTLLDLETALALDLENIESTDLRQQGNWAVWIIAVTVPILTIGLYFQLGEYGVIKNPALAQVPAARQAQDQLSGLSFEEIEDIIKQRLRKNPEDAEGWFMLGKTYMARQKFDKGITAFQRTYDLVGEEPGVMFSLADALAMQNDGVMQGEPEQLVKRGLEISPQDPTGLWLAGLAAEQRQDYKGAHALWSQLMPLIQNDPESSTEVRELIQLLEQRDPQLSASVAVVRILNLSISLADNLRHFAAPGDSVFVYAKAVDGPPMPLAVKRLTVQDLPADVILSDSDAMIQTMKLSTFARVIVGARVSISGNPVAQPGDLFVESGGIDSSNPPPKIELSIDQVK
ncbi:MAG: c-type cytochrome biogenesis protein CcmI [Gammaproteobacteria bacterium]|nr:c-type cytochrome biogenesis protein CcmI [Gammaproteobacteria bacterium]